MLRFEFKPNSEESIHTSVTLEYPDYNGFENLDIYIEAFESFLKSLTFDGKMILDCFHNYKKDFEEITKE